MWGKCPPNADLKPPWGFRVVNPLSVSAVETPPAVLHSPRENTGQSSQIHILDSSTAALHLFVECIE